MNSPVKTITREQIAEMLQVAPKTVDRMRQDGRLPKPLKRMGRTVRWLADDVHRYLGMNVNQS